MLKVICQNSCINLFSELEDLPGLSHMCWPGAWAMITALYSLRAEVPEKAWPLFFFVFFENTTEHSGPHSGVLKLALQVTHQTLV